MQQLPVIRLRAEQLARFMTVAQLASNAALARRMGTVHESTISRVRNGKQHPDRDFIAGLLRAFPGLHFEDLFEITDRDVETGSAA